jgi:membrane protein YdbS with pleckstrin-like domain
MRYADTLLSDGEVVVLRARQHWLALFLDARTAVALWVLAALLMAAVVVFDVNGQGRELLSLAALALLVVGLVLFAYRLWHWWAQDYMVTNRRLLKVEGILNKRSADSSLEKINDAVLDQNIVGRLLNYGDLDILTAADTAIDRYRMLAGAKEFKRQMLNQKHALEMEFSYRHAPSPPLRAPTAGADLNGDGALDGASTSQRASGGVSGGEEPGVPAGSVAAAGPDGSATSAAAEADVAGASMAAATATPRADGASADGAGAGSAAGGGASSPDAVPDTSREITQTLARLADLRDRGAITPEEYEAKKDELLSRL